MTAFDINEVRGRIIDSSARIASNDGRLSSDSSMDLDLAQDQLDEALADWWQGEGRSRLGDMAEEVHQINLDKGWFDNERTFGDGIALLHSELSEALEAYRDYGTDDATRAAREDRPGEVIKPEGVGSEFADVLIRLLDECRRQGIDLQQEYDRKVAYNHTRPHRHGGRSL